MMMMMMMMPVPRTTLKMYWSHTETNFDDPSMRRKKKHYRDIQDLRNVFCRSYSVAIDFDKLVVANKKEQSEARIFYLTTLHYV